MALTIVKFVFPTGSEQNFIGNEVEERWEITGDGVGGAPVLKPKRLKKIDRVEINANDGTGIAYAIDNTVPQVTPTIPAGIAANEKVYITVRGPFA